MRITTAIGESNSPVVVWSGDAFTTSWWDMRGRYPSVHVVRLDRDGVLRSPATMMPHEGVSRDQTLAADGEETHLVWLDEGVVMSGRFSLEDREPTKVALKATDAAAAPWGGVAWASRGNLWFRSDGMLPPANRDGVREEPLPVVLHNGGIEDPSVAWSGKHYAVVWSASVKGGRQILMQRISNKGNLLGKQVKVSATAGISRRPVVVWTGREFAVAWTNAAPSDQNPRDRYRIFFSLVPALDGGPRLTRQLEFNGSADQVALASTGTEFGMAWVGSKKPMGSAVFFGRISAEGKPVGDGLQVSDDKPLACGRPSIAWSGDGYGVVWHDDREAAGSEVFFSFLKCGEQEELATEAEVPPDAGLAPAQPDDAPEAKKGPDEPMEKPAEKPAQDKAPDTPKLKKLFD